MTDAWRPTTCSGHFLSGGKQVSRKPRMPPGAFTSDEIVREPNVLLTLDATTRVSGFDTPAASATREMANVKAASAKLRTRVPLPRISFVRVATYQSAGAGAAVLYLVRGRSSHKESWVKWRACCYNLNRVPAAIANGNLPILHSSATSRSLRSWKLTAESRSQPQPRVARRRICLAVPRFLKPRGQTGGYRCRRAPLGISANRREFRQRSNI